MPGASDRDHQKLRDRLSPAMQTQSDPGGGHPQCGAAQHRGAVYADRGTAGAREIYRGASGTLSGSPAAACAEPIDG